MGREKGKGFTTETVAFLGLWFGREGERRLDQSIEWRGRRQSRLYGTYYAGDLDQTVDRVAC